jgi:hypothetical protein
MILLDSVCVLDIVVHVICMGRNLSLSHNKLEMLLKHLLMVYESKMADSEVEGYLMPQILPDSPLQ